MTREEKVINYYVLCNKLKNIIRTGWTAWNVKKDRLESVAEHIYGVQMLAIAMKSEYNYDINIEKVIIMLAVHELEEIIIGDLTLFDISIEDKKVIGHKAVEEVLSNLTNKEDIRNLIFEFDERKTEEAKFAYFCDKLEADLQAKIYDDEGYLDLKNQEGNVAMNSKEVISLLDKGLSFGKMWLSFSKSRYNYDINFQKVSEYAYNNDLKYKKKDKKEN